MKKPARKPAGGGEWLNTYADMVTLLMTFFIVLLAMSTTNEEKFNAFVNSFSNLPVVETTEPVGNTEDEVFNETDQFSELEQVYEILKQHIVENQQEDNISISRYNDVVYIRFNSSLFFEPDKYTLLRSSLPILDFIGEALVTNQDVIEVVNVLGFTATVDNGTYWMLSGERAAVVATHINFDSGLTSDKLVVMGYGNRYPVAENDTEAGREQNRRVELIIVGTEEEDFNVNELLDAYHDNPDLVGQEYDGEGFTEYSDDVTDLADAGVTVDATVDTTVDATVDTTVDATVDVTNDTVQID